jgi:hypothetical protein
MKFRVDKVTEEQLNEIQSAKQQLESSSARVRQMYGGK